MDQDYHFCLHFYWQKQLLLPFAVPVTFHLKSHSMLIPVALISKEVNSIEEKQVNKKQLQDTLTERHHQKEKQNKTEFSYLSYTKILRMVNVNIQFSQVFCWQINLGGKYNARKGKIFTYTDSHLSIFLLKSLLNLLSIVSAFLLFVCEAGGVLPPRPGIEPAPPASEGETLTTRLPGEFLLIFFLEKSIHVQNPCFYFGLFIFALSCLSSLYIFLIDSLSDILVCKYFLLFIL